MDPYEKKLRDEVLYLHNLWHQGPPSNPHFQNPNLNPYPPPIPHLYDPANSAPIIITSTNDRFRKRKFELQQSDPPPPVSAEWAIAPVVKRHAPPVWAEERAKLPAPELQRRALEASREFFARRVGADCGEEGEEGEVGNGIEESDEFRFFMRVFVEDCELRRFYEERFVGGEFCCLVCGGIGKNVWKRFKDSVGLVQHSKSVTKKKRAHRAFGHVVCKVLGWDIDRLPEIVMKGEPLGRSLASQGSDPWPCEEKPVNEPDLAVSGWPVWKSQASLAIYPASAEENERPASVQLQHKVLEACRGFFKGNAANSDSDDANVESEDEDDLMDRDEVSDSEEFEFLLKIFIENTELRRYYENNHEGGEFCCLVCGGIGKKVWKRFKGCNGLLQHSTAISKTKRKQAHRAYGHVICKVLGWDINKFPMIVQLGKPLSQSLANSGSQSEVEVKGNASVDKDDSEVLKNAATSENEALLLNGNSDAHQNNGVLTVCKGSEPPEVTSTSTSTPQTPCENRVNESTENPQSDIGFLQASAEEREGSASVQSQRKGLEACCRFFAGNANSDIVEDANDDDGIEESEEFKFLTKVFEEDDELRRFYENNHEGGEFCCLVCSDERFKGCNELLQHIAAISKTQKKRAHRAYGHVICKVLGWDINKFPIIKSLQD